MIELDKDLAPFIRAFGHELRQPLSVAQFAAAQNQQALDRLSLKLNAFDWLANALTDEVLAQQALKPRSVAAALADVPRLGMKLQQNIPVELRVLAAPGVLEMVLESLLNNVNKHAPGTSVTVTARVLSDSAKPWPASARIRLSGESVLLTVADAGSGIPAMMRPRLFEPTPRHHWAGLRIGLWLCRLLVRAHGGDIWLDDSECGASFSSVWPKARFPRGTKSSSASYIRQIAALRSDIAQASGAFQDSSDCAIPNPQVC